MPRDFPTELRKGTAFLGLNMDPLARDAADEIERLRAALKPFSDMAGELFARNWNAGDIVMVLDNPNDPHRVTAGDYFAARAAMVLKD